MKTIQLSTSHITLGQLLKQLGIIATGGEAKYFLQEIPVFVNGVIEQRRGRKLVAGDEVKIREQHYQVIDEVN